MSLGVLDFDTEGTLEVPAVAFNHAPPLRQPHRHIVAEGKANRHHGDPTSEPRKRCVVEEDDAEFFQRCTLPGIRFWDTDTAEQSEVPFGREVALLYQDGTLG